MKLWTFFLMSIFCPTLAAAGTVQFSFSGPTEVEVGETVTFELSVFDYVFDKDRIALPQGTLLPETTFIHDDVTVTSWDGSLAPFTTTVGTTGQNRFSSVRDFNDTPESSFVQSGIVDLIFTQAGVFDVSVSSGGRFFSSVGSTGRFDPCCTGSNFVSFDDTIQVSVSDPSVVPLPAGGMLLLSALAAALSLGYRRKALA